VKTLLLFLCVACSSHAVTFAVKNYSSISINVFMNNGVDTALNTTIAPRGVSSSLNWNVANPVTYYAISNTAGGLFFAEGYTSPVQGWLIITDKDIFWTSSATGGRTVVQETYFERVPAGTASRAFFAGVQFYVPFALVAVLAYYVRKGMSGGVTP